MTDEDPARGGGDAPPRAHDQARQEDEKSSMLSHGGELVLGEEERLHDLIPGLGVFSIRRDKRQRPPEATPSALETIQLAYSIVKKVCDKITPGDQEDLLDSVARVHKTYRRRRLNKLAKAQSSSSLSTAPIRSSSASSAGSAGGGGSFEKVVANESYHRAYLRADNSAAPTVHHDHHQGVVGTTSTTRLSTIISRTGMEPYHGSDHQRSGQLLQSYDYPKAFHGDPPYHHHQQAHYMLGATKGAGSHGSVSGELRHGVPRLQWATAPAAVEEPAVPQVRQPVVEDASPPLAVSREALILCNLWRGTQRPIGGGARQQQQQQQGVFRYQQQQQPPPPP